MMYFGGSPEGSARLRFVIINPTWERVIGFGWLGFWDRRRWIRCEIKGLYSTPQTAHRKYQAQHHGMVLENPTQHHNNIVLNILCSTCPEQQCSQHTLHNTTTTLFSTYFAQYHNNIVLKILWTTCSLRHCKLRGKIIHTDSVGRTTCPLSSVGWYDWLLTVWWTHQWQLHWLMAAKHFYIYGHRQKM